MKLLVGCPTSDRYNYCIDDYLKRLKEFVYKDFDLLIVDNSKDDVYSRRLENLGINVIRSEHLPDVRERIVASRNIIREYVLNNGYDYFLSLEQDVIPPKDALPRLLRHKQKIVSGIYFKIYDLKITNTGKADGIIQKRAKTLMPVLFRFASEPEKMHICGPSEVEGERFFKVRACGLGCLLIHRDVLENISFRKDPSAQEAFDDVLFCTDAYKNSFEIFADTSVKCRHLIMRKGEIKE